MLADTAFPFCYPAEYQKTVEILESTKTNNQETLATVSKQVEHTLKKSGIPIKLIDYRVKGTYSLYKKLVRKDWNIEEINDIVALVS